MKRQCTAENRHGEPCELAPIKGGTVCHKHGGSARQVKNAARRRLNALAEPAVALLSRILEDDRDLKAGDKERIRAAIAVLDRTGHGPSAKVEMEERPWERLLRESMADFVHNPEAYPEEYAGMPHYERRRYDVYRGHDPEEDDE
ncbi:hypothetical protein [Micromonospora sp. HK10]|uniref:hypothetical protein n=1 Tax=Micromonospora sp. HK10 TaxID=1538294 RepID=UPI000628CE98|nr:hypothetical protein [Micromonospora sp. HK10]KKK05546.1 hypothetical protein LQ51_13330 [Micromonospora sp. HK10]